MRFALLIWQDLVDAGGHLSQKSNEVLDAYLSALRDEVVSADLVRFSMAPAAEWTYGEPYDGIVKGHGPRTPDVDPTVLYRSIELSAILTVECDNQQTALLWASRFPFIVSVEVRPIPTNGDGDGDALASASAMRQVARGYWADPTEIASQRVDDIIWHRHDLVPSLLRALADAAPAGKLHMIGVGPLESLSIDARDQGMPDPTLDLLIAAEIPGEMLVEILSGPWPEYLTEWNAIERLAGILSESQLRQLKARSGP
jgi:hypothetical protein